MLMVITSSDFVLDILATDMAKKCGVITLTHAFCELSNGILRFADSGLSVYLGNACLTENDLY